MKVGKVFSNSADMMGLKEAGSDSTQGLKEVQDPPLINLATITEQDVVPQEVIYLIQLAIHWLIIKMCFLGGWCNV